MIIIAFFFDNYHFFLGTDNFGVIIFAKIITFSAEVIIFFGAKSGPTLPRWGKECARAAGRGTQKLLKERTNRQLAQLSMNKKLYYQYHRLGVSWLQNEMRKSRFNWPGRLPKSYLKPLLPSMDPKSRSHSSINTSFHNFLTLRTMVAALMKFCDHERISAPRHGRKWKERQLSDYGIFTI